MLSIFFSVSITSIEDFSNEIFLEVFDYLDGYELYTAFSNFNNRFQCLITSSSFLLKISLDNERELDMEYYCRHVIIPNRHLIISLIAWNTIYLNDFFTYCLLDETFIRLESILFSDITVYNLMYILFELKSLPRLFSLSIMISDDGLRPDLSGIYRMIFRLPSLRYNYLLSSKVDELNILIPYVINDRFSSLRTLIIHHDCTLNELISILYHTPQLCRFSCEGTIEPSDEVENKVSLKLPSLIEFSIWSWHMEFIDFEKFLNEISSPLQILRFHNLYAEDYIDPDQWNRLVLKYLPHLRKFSVKCFVNIDNIFTDLHFNSFTHYFNARFGIGRGWMLSFVMDNSRI